MTGIRSSTVAGVAGIVKKNQQIHNKAWLVFNG